LRWANKYLPEVHRAVDDLDELIMEAAETERRLPSPFRKQKLASWPEYQTEWLSYGDIVYSPNLPKATTLQVTKYEYVLMLLLDQCDEHDRRLIWAVAHSGAFRERGPKWTKLAKAYHRDRRTLKNDYKAALIKLYYRFTSKKPKIFHRQLSF
tara:strand:- start:379 stop:837 length:459 start_codon:yes stop_codon:yes gene_type:complete